MGAIDQNELAVGRYKNASEAYNSLVETAEYEYGHDGYNGTISTSDGFFDITGLDLPQQSFAFILEPTR